MAEYAAYFGVGTAVDRSTVSEAVSALVYRDGLGASNWPQERTETVTREKTDYTDWGTASSDAGAAHNSTTAVIDSANWTQTEIVSAKKLVGTDGFDICPGAVPDIEAPQILTQCDGLLWLGVDHTLTLTGKFGSGASASGWGDADTLLRELLTEGGHITKDIFLKGVSQIGTTGMYINVPASADFSQQPYVQTVDRNCNMEWNTFTTSLQWVVPQAFASTDASLLLADLVTWGDAQADFPADATYYKITRNVTMSAEANPSLTETIEFYHEDQHGILISDFPGGPEITD